MPSGEDNCCEEKIIMAGGNWDGQDNHSEIDLCKCVFSMGSHPMQFHTASESFHYQVRLVYFMDIRPEGLKISTNTGEVSFDGGGSDEVEHINSEEAEHVFSWVDGEAMVLADSGI